MEVTEVIYPHIFLLKFFSVLPDFDKESPNTPKRKAKCTGNILQLTQKREKD